MNAYIKKIALFSKDAMREVDLDDGLNIITGDSKTGKSALIEIVDYCLFSSRSTIPVGKITDFTELFCIIIQVGNKYLVIARPHWKSPDRRKAYFSFEIEKDFLNSFSREYFDVKNLRVLNDVQVDVERHLGLSVLDTRDSNESSKQSAGKATMRSFISLLFQHQNLIANKHSLFYRFDDFQKRKKTIDQFPILMGWVDGEFYLLKQQLEEKEGVLRKEHKRIESMKFSEQEQIERLRTPIHQYYRAIGYILDEKLTLKELKEIAENLPDMPMSAYEDSDIATNLLQFKKRRDQYRSEISEVNTLVQQIDDNGNDAHDYANALKHLISVSDIDTDLEGIECPVCHSKSANTEGAVETVISSREGLISELKSVGGYTTDSSEHLKELLEKRDLLKRNIRKLSAEITEFEKVLKISNEDQALRDSIMKLKGRIEVILEQILQKPILNLAPFDLKELKGDINFIKERLEGYNLNSKIQEANVFLSKKMTEISDKLDFEKELKPGTMHFDLETFDFYYIYEKQKIRLSEMGSGANWLACHLSLFLSLLRLSCKEEKSCIPSFLFIDQPSQVYFPKATKALLKENGQILDTNEDKEFDENIKQVVNIFKVILEEVEAIKNDCGFAPQLIVMEHADEKEFNIFVKKRWATNGEKLI